MHTSEYLHAPQNDTSARANNAESTNITAGHAESTNYSQLKDENASYWL